MDEQQRRQIGDQARAERETQGLSLRALAKLADVSVNTIRSLEAGTRVQPSSLSRIQDALHIEPSVEVARRIDEPPSVHAPVELVRAWLLGMDEDRRLRAVQALVRTVMTWEDTGQ